MAPRYYHVSGVLYFSKIVVSCFVRLVYANKVSWVIYRRSKSYRQRLQALVKTGVIIVIFYGVVWHGVSSTILDIILMLASLINKTMT